MIVFVFIVFIFGFLVLAIIATFISTILVYILAYIITFIKLRLVGKPFDSFKQQCNQAGNCANQSWIAKYCRYFINDYFRIIWGYDKMRKPVIKSNTESKEECRNKNRIDDTVPIPLYDKANYRMRDYSHTKKVSLPNKEVNQNGTIPSFRVLTID